MDDYTQYVTSVNKIFDYLEKLKAGWNNQDNKNYIDSISDYKNAVTSKAEDFKKPPLPKSTEEQSNETAAAAVGTEQRTTQPAQQASPTPQPVAGIPELPDTPEI